MPQVDLEMLKKSNEIVSPLESYSILEKIQEWKREEGISNGHSQDDYDIRPTQIPRPLKLIMDITMEDLGLNQQPVEIEEKSKMSGNGAGDQLPMNDFRNYIKQEQDNLKR